MKLFKIKNIVLLLSFLVTQHANSEISITKVEINPLNRIILYCSELPTEFTTDLSPDKTKITINIEKTIAVDSVKENHGTGIIRDVYIQNYKNFARLFINLQDKRGYTLTPLPYSKAFMVETFGWNSLTPQEDDYRSGLLAYESKIFSSAKKYFIRASHNGVTNASGFLGLIELSEGQVDKALNDLESSVKSESNIADFYAALSQIYSIKNQTSKSDYYRKLFNRKTGLSDFPYMEVPQIPQEEEQNKEPISYLDRLNDPNYIDSTELSAIDSIKSGRGNDSVSKSTQKVDTTYTILSDNTNNSESNWSPVWLTKTIFYIIFASIIVLITLFSLYYKWRKAQIKKIRRESTQKFSEKLKTAQSAMTGTAHAANVYKKTDKIIDNPIESKPEQHKSKINETKKENKVSSPEENLKRIADEIIAAKSITKNSENENSLPQKKQFGQLKENKTNPKLDLALHLHEEQQKLNERNIKSMKQTEIPTDRNKLAEVARKLGLEKSSLETQRMLSKLSSDKQTLSKLADKFSVNKDDK